MISYKKSDTQKIQLTIAINFISSKDIGKEHVMHSKSDNIEIMINEKVDEVITSITSFQIPNWMRNIDERQ